MTRSWLLSSALAHIWQTTLFAGAVWLALQTVLRRLPARLRFSLWLTASLKFLVPFSILTAVGAMAGSTVPFHAVEAQPVAAAADLVAGAPLSRAVIAWQAPALASGPSMTDALLAAWLAGVAIVLLRRVAEWIRVSRFARRARWIARRNGVDVLESTALRGAGCEPGVFGAFRPVLLVPAGLTARLTPPQLEAVLAHECCHVRRRDNLTGAIHSLVEAVFWFHPLAWWLGQQLRRERERACDDDVMRRGADPTAYAEGILTVCRLYVETRATVVAPVTGADLRRRVERIVAGGPEPPVTRFHRLWLGAAAALCVTVPLASGAMVAAQQVDGGPDVRTDTTELFEVASVKPNQAGEGQRGAGFQQGGRFRARNMTTRGLIAAAYGSPQPLPLFRVVGGAGWIDSERYDVDAAPSEAIAPTLTPPWPGRGQSMLRTLLRDRFKLVARQEARELPVYELVVLKPSLLGPQLRVSTGSDCASPASANGGAPPAGAAQIACGGFRVTPPERLSGRYLTMDQLARFLALNVVERSVINRTGLAGHYSWELDYTRDVPAAPAGAAEPALPTGTSIFTALTEQLGLRLVSTRAPLDVVVIDSISRPTPD